VAPPLISLAAALVAGILVGDALHLAPAVSLAVAGVFAGAAALLVFLRGSSSWVLAAALAAVAATAAADTMRRRPEYSSPLLHGLLSNRPRLLRVRGWVRTERTERVLPPWHHGQEPRRVGRFDLAVTGLYAGDRWRPAGGRLRITVEGGLGEEPVVEYGDVVEMAALIRAAPPASNPGEFDYRSYLARMGIAGLGRVADPAGIRPTGGHWGLPLLRHVFRFKRRARAAIRASMPERAAAIVQCLALGDRFALTGDQERAFRETGLVHFLAISGLHVGLLAAFCWMVLAVCGVRHRPAAVAVLAVVFLYALLAGFRPSVQRAAIMCAAVCGAFFFQRRPRLGHSLALALVVILLHQPAELFSAGLQLSFTAVLGIWLFSDPLERALFRTPGRVDHLEAPEERPWFRHPVRWLVQKTFAVSLAAWLSILPLALHYFGMANLLTPAATVFMLPLVWAAVVTGLAGVVLGPALGGYAMPFLATAGLAAWAMDRVAGLVAAVPGTLLRLPRPGWGWVALTGAVWVAVALRHRLRLSARRVGLLLCVPAFAYLGLVWHRPWPAHPRASVLSVGMGNCVVVQLPGGRTLLFDAGRRGSTESGSQVIAPALWSLGVRRVDLVMLSHGDADHYNGLEGLSEFLPVGRIAVSPYFKCDRSAAEALDRVDPSGTRRVEVARGDRLAGFGDAEVEVLWPPRDFLPAREMTDNELSMVVRVRTPCGSVLLTGDFGARAAKMLVDSGEDLRVDVLQVPHHGLPDPAAEALAAAVRPRVAVIPGGRYAERPSPYARWTERLLATDDCGMISVELLGPGRIRVETFRPVGPSQQR